MSLALIARIDQVERTLGKLDRAFGEVAARRSAQHARLLAERASQDAFERQADPYAGAPWPPHRRPLGHPLLQDTGELRSAVRARVEKRGSGWAMEVGVMGDGALIRKANAMNFGSKGPGAHTIGRRRFVGLPKAAVGEIKGTFRKAVLKESR